MGGRETVLHSTLLYVYLSTLTVVYVDDLIQMVDHFLQLFHIEMKIMCLSAML